ncbi:MAG TPA: hypothetical protein VMV10_07215 [Pirellulales bacterium]|nr:hypothetical protein [Pirellulales bacterium]
MLQSRDRAAESPEAPKAENVLVPGTRVDAAHVVGDAPASANEPAAEKQAHPSDAPWAAVDPSEVAQAVAFQAELEAVLLQAQAEQLAQHLRSRQEDLDRREAQLNARCAEFDQEVRTARLWLSERQQELAQREDDMLARERALAAGAAQRSAAADGDCEERRIAEENALRARFEELAERERCLIEAETSLSAQQAETAAFERELQQRREQLEAQARLDRRRLAEIQRKNDSELARKKLGVERQSEQLDHRRAAVERSRQDLLRLQREALELRLAAEELRAELEGSLAPAAVERSLSALRGRLGEYYRLEAASAAEERAELESLKTELAAEAERWSGRQQDLQQWATARQAEFDERAARLEAREQELDRLEKSRQEQQQLWRAERFNQQQLIRRLQAELRQRAA